MAGRPKTSAAILKLRGAFVAHPERAREDAPGAGPWNPEPPDYLTGKEQAAWREVVEWLPKVALTLTERLGAIQMARLWAVAKDTNSASAEYIKIVAELRQWAGQMGLTLQARAKLGTSGKQGAPGKFAGVRGEKAPTDDRSA